MYSFQASYGIKPENKMEYLNKQYGVKQIDKKRRPTFLTDKRFFIKANVKSTWSVESYRPSAVYLRNVVKEI